MHEGHEGRDPEWSISILDVKILKTNRKDSFSDPLFSFLFSSLLLPVFVAFVAFVVNPPFLAVRDGRGTVKGGRRALTTSPLRAPLCPSVVKSSFLCGHGA